MAAFFKVLHVYELAYVSMCTCAVRIYVSAISTCRDLMSTSLLTVCNYFNSVLQVHVVVIDVWLVQYVLPGLSSDINSLNLWRFN